MELLTSGICLLFSHFRSIPQHLRSWNMTFLYYTASEDGTARVWDLQAPAVAATEHHQGKVTRAIVLPSSNFCVTIGEDNAALVWDVENANCKHMLQGHQTGLNWAFIVADGRQLVTASGNIRYPNIEYFPLPEMTGM